MKRKFDLEQQQQQQLIFVSVKRQLRSKLPRRRRRFPISPVLHELSCECDSSSRASVVVVLSKPRPPPEDNRETYADVEVSESSCVESCSGAVSREIVEKKLKEKFYPNEAVSEFKRFLESEKDIARAEDFETVNKSELSAVLSLSGGNSKFGEVKVKGTENSLEINSNDVVSVVSVSQFEKAVRKGEEREEEERESGAESKQQPVPMDFDFTCSENFTNYGVCVPCYCSSSYSELQSEVFPESFSDFDFSDYTPSIWYDDSCSQFSEKSINDERPSPAFQLFLQFSQQFCRSNFPFETNIDDIDSHDLSVLGLEEEEDSYRMIKRRERRQVYLHDYAEEYCSTTDYGDLIIQQRLQMVHWIVEQSTSKEFQRETMFLGVSLFDRFLSKGYFKSKKNLQIAGIACLTLATRIEEKQPFNSIQQKIFYIGSNAYSRCEVVAMEWLVQEVLKFQCFLPSMYNFLWFYLKAARASEKVDKTVKYLAVLALLGHEQLCYWPSTVAAGLVILASIAANKEACCYSVTETHARIKDDHLPECIKSLAWMVKYIT